MPISFPFKYMILFFPELKHVENCSNSTKCYEMHAGQESSEYLSMFLVYLVIVHTEL